MYCALDYFFNTISEHHLQQFPRKSINIVTLLFSSITSTAVAVLILTFSLV